MKDPNTLPFPEPASEEIAELASAFLVLSGGNRDYSEEQARQDAIKYLEYKNAVTSGFLEDSGVVQTNSGHFYLDSSESS